MKPSLMKYAQILVAQNLFLLLISAASNAVVDFVQIVNLARASCANLAHRKISFLCNEFFGTIVDDLIISTLILPSLLLA